MNQSIRIGDAERDAAVGLLARHFADGRLTQVEHDERVSLALAARTRADLSRLFADLPVVDGDRRPALPRWPLLPIASVGAVFVMLVVMGMFAAFAFTAVHFVPVIPLLLLAFFVVRIVNGRTARARRRDHRADNSIYRW